MLCNVVRWEWLGFLRELAHSSHWPKGRAIHQQVGMPRYVCLHPSFATWMGWQSSLSLACFKIFRQHILYSQKMSKGWGMIMETRIEHDTQWPFLSFLSFLWDIWDIWDTFSVTWMVPVGWLQRQRSLGLVSWPHWDIWHRDMGDMGDMGDIQSQAENQRTPSIFPTHL